MMTQKIKIPLIACSINDGYIYFVYLYISNKKLYLLLKIYQRGKYIKYVSERLIETIVMNRKVQKVVLKNTPELCMLYL